VRVLLAHAEEIVATRAMAHPTVVVGVVPIPAIAAYEALAARIVDPRQCRGLADVRARIRLWAEWRRGLLQGEAWRVLPGAPPRPEDPPTPAG